MKIEIQWWLLGLFHEMCWSFQHAEMSSCHSRVQWNSPPSISDKDAICKTEMSSLPGVRAAAMHFCSRWLSIKRLDISFSMASLYSVRFLDFIGCKIKSQVPFIFKQTYMSCIAPYCFCLGKTCIYMWSKNDGCSSEPNNLEQHYSTLFCW